MAVHKKKFSKNPLALKYLTSKSNLSKKERYREKAKTSISIHKKKISLLVFVGLNNHFILFFTLHYSHSYILQFIFLYFITYNDVLDCRYVVLGFGCWLLYSKFNVQRSRLQSFESYSLLKRSSLTPLIYAKQPFNTGCKCIGFHRGLVSILSLQI